MPAAIPVPAKAIPVPANVAATGRLGPKKIFVYFYLFIPRILILCGSFFQKYA